MLGRGLCALGFGLLVVAAASAPAGVFDGRGVRRLGSWSYAYFLLNAPMLGVTGVVVLAAQPPVWVAFAAVAATAVLTWPVAGAARRWVELPAARVFGPRRLSE